MLAGEYSARSQPALPVSVVPSLAEQARAPARAARGWVTIGGGRWLRRTRDCGRLCHLGYFQLMQLFGVSGIPDQSCRRDRTRHALPALFLEAFHKTRNASFRLAEGDNLGSP